jgi:hypothetical protein
MRITARPSVRLAAALALRVLGALDAFGALALPAGAHELKDVSLIAAGGKAQLKLAFTAGPGETEFPLYFQKGDAGKSTLTLSFLETGTSFPLGRHALDANAPELGEITLKKVTSPSGKNFLGVELLLRDAASQILADGEAEVETAPKGTLKIQLGKSAVPKYEWSLAKALQAGDAYLSAKAAPAPKASKAEKAARAAAAAEREAASAFSAPVPAEPASPPAAGAPSAAQEAAGGSAAPESEPQARKARLVEIQVRATAAQEDLVLIFDPPASPNHMPGRDPKDSSWMEILIDHAASGLGRKEYVLPGGTVFQRVKTSLKGGKLAVRVKLAKGESPNVMPQDNGLVITALGKGGSESAFAWSSRHPDAPAAEAKAVAKAGSPPAAEAAAKDGAKPEEAPDPVTSAHADGQALEKSFAGGNGGKAKGGLSSSRVFVPGKGGKTLVILKDSIALLPEAGAQGKPIRKIPIGEKAEKIDAKGGKLRVVAGQDTGWIRASEAAYADELTAAQEKSIQDKLASNQARLEAAQAKLAAAQAKEEEKKRKADAAAAEAQRKLAEKQAAEDAKRQAAEDAKRAQAAAAAAAKAAANPPAGIQEAGAAPNRVGPPSAAGGPGRPGTGAPGAAAAPKLGLADNPELADKLARERQAAEDEKKRIEPEENRVTYNSYGRRDPFIPVEQGAADNGIDIDQMKVVGIIWQASQPMAVLEHNREAGVSFTVKEGDPVHNGRVARISHDAVTFDISEYGISRSYSLRLVSNAKEGAKK